MVEGSTKLVKLEPSREALEAGGPAGWPVTATCLSILLERGSPEVGTSGVYAVDFLVRELALPYLYAGAPLPVMEGPRVVGDATVVEVRPDDAEDGLRRRA